MLWPRLFLCAIAAALALVACGGRAAYPQAASGDLTIGGVLIENHGRSTVYAAKLLVPTTGRFVSCGNIAPGGACTTGFPEERFTGHPVELSWSQQGEIWSTGALDLEPTETVIAAGEALLQIVIVGPGSAGAALVAKP